VRRLTFCRVSLYWFHFDLCHSFACHSTGFYFDGCHSVLCHFTGFHFYLCHSVSCHSTGFHFYLCHSVVCRLSFCSGKNEVPGSTISNGREPKSCLGRVFNFKLGCFAQQKHK
jgi:hypothetical protein